MGYELVWDKKKRKMIKKKTNEPKQLDKLHGTEDTRELTDSLLKKYIPNAYFRVNNFSEKTLKKELPISRKNRDVSVDVYINFMEDYLNRIRNGRKPNKSYFLAAPDGFGKKTFAYQVIKDALAHRMEPTPILATQKLYTLLDKRAYDELYKKFDEVDIAILTMGGAPTRADLIVIKTVLEHCERNNVPILILSRFAPETFYKMDEMNALFLGVGVTKKGDFGRTELKGFNRTNMQKIREDIRNSLKK